MASEFPKWRDELPTEPGWYWMDDARWESDHLIVACLRMHHGRLCLFSPSTFEYWPLANYDKCRWSGPLTPPPNEPAVVSMWQVVLRKTVELETPPGHVPEFAETIWEYNYTREPTIADIAECRTRCGMGDAAAEVYRVVDGGWIWDSTHVVANVCQAKE